VFFRAVGIVVGSFAAVCGLGALTFRPDTEAELFSAWAADLFVGFLFAVAFLLVRVGRRGPGSRERAARRTVLGTVLVGAVTAGTLVAVQASVARARFRGPQTVTIDRLNTVRIALDQYRTDCGAWPDNEQGLGALRENPGVPGWAGPYVERRALTDAWENPVRYDVLCSRGRVWSNGPDGQFGTEDDVTGGN
jgi:type II secretory pathway pseudopilin PulG